MSDGSSIKVWNMLRNKGEQGGRNRKKVYQLEGLDCANCAAKMEEAVRQTAGVKDATLSFMTLKLKVEFEEGADVNRVMKEALKNCKRVESDCEIFL